jgi:hypothetical protein
MKRKNSEHSEAYQRVQDELLPGEELLWVGQPNPKYMRPGRSGVGNKAALLSIVVGLQVLLVLGGAFFSISSSSTSSDSGTVTTTHETPWILIAVVGMIVLVGVLGLVLVLFRSWQRKHTIYAITDRRVLTINGDSVRSDGEQDIEFIERNMHRDGTGDIIYRRELQTSTGYYGGSVFAPQTSTTNVGFFGITDPHYVEELMLDVFRPDAYPGKQKHEEAMWDDADDTLLDELDNLVSKSS